MDSYKLSFKLFAQAGATLGAQELVPVFHRWIRAHAIADHLAIDVADYAHVPEGPGTMLITHEANFAMDSGGGKPGLLYVRKQPFAQANSLGERLRAALLPVLEAAYRLEGESSLAGKISFRTDAFEFRIYDRLLAPDTEATFAQVKPELEALTKQLYGSAAELAYAPRELSPFAVTIRGGTSPRLSELLHRLTGAAPL